MTQNEHYQPKGYVQWFLSWRGVALTVALGGLSYYLMTEHREHLAVAIPFIFLLACPLMHIFGHGHGGHGDKEHDGSKSNPHEK